MLLIPSLLAAMTIALSPAPDWIVAQGTGNCSGNYVDFSDAKHGLVACSFSDAMATNDGGLTWSVFPTGLAQSLVYAHAVSPTELYLARLGLYRSVNGGATWTEVGHLSDNFGSLFDVHFDGAHLVALQGGNILYSENGGSTWQTGFPSQQDVYLDELHFPTGQVGYASGGITYELGSFGSILRTQNGGTSWTQLNFPHGQVTAAAFSDATHGIVATISSNVHATADAGASWQLVGPLPDSAYLADLVERSTTHWYGVAHSGCIYETFSAGATWTPSYCDPTGRALASITLDGGAAVAVGSDGLALYENRVFQHGFD